MQKNSNFLIDRKTKIIMSVLLFLANLRMEQLNVSLLLLNNTFKDMKYPENTTSLEQTSGKEMILTTLQEETNDATIYKFTPVEVANLVILLGIIVFGSVGNILTFIIMQRG